MAVRKPRLVFKGTRRQKLRKLKRALELIESMDWEENVKAASDGRDPDLFVTTTAIGNALGRLKNQGDELLAFKR